MDKIKNSFYKPISFQPSIDTYLPQPPQFDYLATTLEKNLD